jgi:hypothetical protein
VVGAADHLDPGRSVHRVQVEETACKAAKARGLVNGGQELGGGAGQRWGSRSSKRGSPSSGMSSHGAA